MLVTGLFSYFFYYTFKQLVDTTWKITGKLNKLEKPLKFRKLSNLAFKDLESLNEDGSRK